MNLISLSHVTKTIVDGRRKQRIVDDVSLSIDRGEFLAIVGPSGSGKSTLLNILGLLDKPTHGEYLFDGASMLGVSGGRLATFRNQNIGFVFQSFMLLPRMTVIQNVELPLLYSRIGRSSRRKRAREVLDQVGMLSKQKQTSLHLSGGEKQRVAIARALVNNPDLILADEPTGNLDEQSKQGVLEVFLSLRRQNRTIVMVTHDTQAASIADRFLTIRGGKVDSESGLFTHSSIVEEAASTPVDRSAQMDEVIGEEAPS